MNLVTMVSLLGLDNSAHRWYWDSEKQQDRKKTLASWAWCQIVFSLIFAFLIFCLSGVLEGLLVRRGDSKIYFQLSAMALPLGVLGGVTTNWLRMQRRPWATVSFSIGTNLFNVVMTIVLVVIFNWGLKGIYVSQLVTAVLSTGVAMLLLRDWVHPNEFDWLRLKEMLRYSFPLIPAGLSYWVVHLSWSYFIRGFSSTAEVGLYQVGTYIASVVALVTSAFQQAWGPFAMSIQKHPDAKKVYADVFLAYFWVAFLLSTALCLFSPEILIVFTTKAYQGASRITGILSFGYALIGLGYIAVIGSAIAKTTKPYGKAVIIAAIVTIFLNLALVPRFGKEGSAVATLLAQLVVPLYVFYYSQKVYPIPYRFGVALKLSALSLVAVFLGGIFIPVTGLFWGICIKTVLLLTFFPALVLFRIVNFEEARRFLTGAVNRLRI
jgi:O-antigen/teichoic acid export membrane protein